MGIALALVAVRVATEAVRELMVVASVRERGQIFCLGRWGERIQREAPKLCMPASVPMLGPATQPATDRLIHAMFPCERVCRGGTRVDVDFSQQHLR